MRQDAIPVWGQIAAKASDASNARLLPGQYEEEPCHASGLFPC
jgi:hypothetical protein